MAGVVSCAASRKNPGTEASGCLCRHKEPFDATTNMIPAQNISVVFQGPIASGQADVVHHNVRQVKRLLPQSEIIISTWRGSGVADLNCEVDQIIESTDPGIATLGWDSKCNINRQICSTQTGLNVATRQYAMKIRLDSTLSGLSFLEVYAKMLSDSQVGPASLFRQRVLATSLYFRDAAKSNYLFHPSDTFQFGLRSDLHDLWNVPLVGEGDPVTEKLALVPEQYLWIRYLLSKGIPAKNVDASRFRWSSMIMSEWSLATNWWVVAGERHGIDLPARFLTTNLPGKTHFEEEWNSFAMRSGRKPSWRACRWNVVRKFTRKVRWP